MSWGHQLIPAGAGQGAASDPDGEDVLLVDLELLEHLELRFRTLRGIVGLAGSGVAAGDGDHEVILAQGPLCPISAVLSRSFAGCSLWKLADWG